MNHLTSDVEYPANFARFYDLIYHKQRDGVDNEYFHGEIMKAKGRVLEVGAGTGRMFTRALEAGADIYGIDISENMLNILKSKINPDQNYRISKQNMTDFSFEHCFDLIVAPFRVFMHLSQKEDQIQALNNVYSNLNSNGRFIFDTFIPDLSQLLNGLSGIVDFESEYEPGKYLRRIVSTVPDLINQIINVSFRLEWKESEKDMKEDWIVPLRYFFRYELEHLVERSSFKKNYRIIGDYKGNPLSNLSKEFIIICEK
jgi:SAM-dependent methyltransferase